MKLKDLIEKYKGMDPWAQVPYLVFSDVTAAAGAVNSTPRMRRRGAEVVGV